MKRINTILDAAKFNQVDTNHTDKVGKRRLKFRDSVEINPTGSVQSMAPCPWMLSGDKEPHFLFTTENGTYHLVVDGTKIY